MAMLARRIRVLDRLLKLIPEGNLARMTPERFERARTRRVKHNRLVDSVFGGIAAGVTLRDVRFPDPRDPAVPHIKARLYTPAPSDSREIGTPLPIVLYFHGGGFVYGNPDTCDFLASRLAAKTPALVVAVDYRLAPKHVFPAAVDDCYASLLWTSQHGAEWGGDPRRIAVAGDSAGGTLATVVCLQARDEQGPAIAAQALIYPATAFLDPAADLPPESSAYRNRDKPFLSLAEVGQYDRLYFGREPDPADWRAFPAAAASHAGLPPALVQVAEHDLLLDDGRDYAALLRKADVPVRLTEYAGMPHAFVTFPGVCSAARPAVDEAAGFLREHLAVAGR